MIDPTNRVCSPPFRPQRRRGCRVATVTALALALLALTPAGAPAKEAIDFLGSEAPSSSGGLGGDFGGSSGVAISQTGAGGVNPGDVYALDQENNRVQRFARDDNGTPGTAPADIADDTYVFVSAWGADVVGTGGTGDLGGAADANYEICKVAAECKAGVASGGNGTAAGNGSLSLAGYRVAGIAVDQDTGHVYVVDAGNHRVNVYEADGGFLRSFGLDVVGSGPGGMPGADEQQTLTVNGDGGKFSLDFKGVGTASRGVAWRSRSGETLLKSVKVTQGALEVGQSISGDGIAPGTTITGFPSPTTILISKPTTSSTVPGTPFYINNLDHDATAQDVEESLNQLATIGGTDGSVTVSGSAGGPYTIDFGGSLAGRDQPPIAPSGGGLTGGSSGGSATLAETVQGGAFEVCVASDGSICRGGGSNDRAGALGDRLPAAGGTSGNGEPGGIAVSAADGNASSGSLFIADAGNSRVGVYDLDGSNPESIGSAVEFSPGHPRQVAVDSRGILYADNQDGAFTVERYDTENANGEGIGFLQPIPPGVNEVQELTVDATAGTFRLTFDPDGTGPEPVRVSDEISFDASATGSESEFVQALRDLLGGRRFRCCVLGGPGNAGGTNPYTIEFDDAFGTKDIPEIAVDDSGLSGGTGASVTTVADGEAGLIQSDLGGLAVDPDSDGGGSDSDVVYTMQRGSGVIQQFGPLNSPGLTVPPTADDERHGNKEIYRGTGLGVEQASGRIYVGGFSQSEEVGRGVFVLGESGPPPAATIDSVDGITAGEADVHATIDPNGPPILRYRFEYWDDGGTTWRSTPEVALGIQENPQQVDHTLAPPPIGLQPNTEYKVRLVAGRRFAAPVATGALTFTTDPAPPLAVTVGSPIRTTSAIQLSGRVAPRNSATDFHFEYGVDGPCDLNPCSETPARSAGSSDAFRLVAARISGLDPRTTYHYRVVADNGVGGPIAGEDMSATTLASASLPGAGSDFPGPPGSDRAWEQVSLAETSGNPVGPGFGFSDSGSRALYGILGGTPISSTGGLLSFYFAERTAEGWRTKNIAPPRSGLIGERWRGPFGPTDLSVMVAENHNSGDHGSLWRLSPDGAPHKLFEPVPPEQTIGAPQIGVSADGSRMVSVLRGGALDPEFPAATDRSNIYDIGGTSPRLLSLLPGNEVASCGVGVRVGGPSGAFAEPSSIQASNWVSADGSLLYFPSQGHGPCGGGGAASQLYVRDLNAGETILISRPPLSGPNCGSRLLRAVPGSAFFSTSSRLTADDKASAGCSGGLDIYRYDLAQAEYECLTCIATDFASEVDVNNGPSDVAVSEDGSRIYFSSEAGRLLPGAGANGVYRLRVADRDLDYVAPIGNVGSINSDVALSDDGSLLAFRSDAEALNPLGDGTENAGTSQYYLYNDDDGSLTCVSCPKDGSAPLGDLAPNFVISYNLDPAGRPNLMPLANDGTFAFATATPLASDDHNTPSAGDSTSGTDIYEWRDGRQLLVTDGQTVWSDPPVVAGVNPSGHDIFFRAAARYTADAPDALPRLYDARIGGGFEFRSEELRPCNLSSGSCEGAPSRAPDLPGAGSAAFEGPGNPTDLRPGGNGQVRCAPLVQRFRRLALAARRLQVSAKRAAHSLRRSSNPRRKRSARRVTKRYMRAARHRAAAAKRRRVLVKRCRAASQARANDNRRAER